MHYTSFFAQAKFTWSFTFVDCSMYVGVSLSFVMILSEAGYTTLSDSVFWLAKKLQQRSCHLATMLSE